MRAIIRKSGPEHSEKLARQKKFPRCNPTPGRRSPGVGPPSSRPRKRKQGSYPGQDFMAPSPACNTTVTIESQNRSGNPGDKMRIVKIFSVLAVLLALGTVAVAEGGQVLLNAAGATFPYPIYSKWFDQYHQAHPNVQINYQSIGSGGGLRQLLDKTVDFGASDGPMSDDQLKTASVPILHFPTVLGAAIPSYNVPG